jgi:hypothetical protein
MKFGIENLCKDLDLTPQSVRIKLRNNNVKKNKETGQYGWDTRADYDKIVGLWDKKAKKKVSAKKPVAKKKPVAEAA